MIVCLPSVIDVDSFLCTDRVLVERRHHAGTIIPRVRATWPHSHRPRGDAAGILRSRGRQGATSSLAQKPDAWAPSPLAGTPTRARPGRAAVVAPTEVDQVTIPSRRPRGPSPSTCRLLIAVTAVFLLALSMRIPTISLGPLLPAMRTDTGHGETFLSLLTAVPLALTLLVAPVTPRIAARVGRSRLLCSALAGVGVGIVLRSVPGDAFLLAGTTILGTGIVIGTVLAPAAIAAEPHRWRAMLTSVYSTGLSVGPALALGLTIPMMRVTGFGWRGTLVLWALVVLAALVAWLVYGGVGARSGPAAGPWTPAPASTPRGRMVLGDHRVWLLAVYLGLTSLGFYTTSTWLPTTFVLDGAGAGAAGGAASMVNLVAIPFAMAAPVLMRRGFSPLLAPLGQIGRAHV